MDLVRFSTGIRPSKSGEGPAYLDVHVLIRFTDHSTNGIRFNILIRCNYLTNIHLNGVC